MENKNISILFTIKYILQKFSEEKVLEILKEAKILKLGLWKPKRSWIVTPVWGIERGKWQRRMSLVLGWTVQFEKQWERRLDEASEDRWGQRWPPNSKLSALSSYQMELPLFQELFLLSPGIKRTIIPQFLLNEWTNDQMTASGIMKSCTFPFGPWLSILVSAFYFNDFFLSMMKLLFKREKKPQDYFTFLVVGIYSSLWRENPRLEVRKFWFSGTNELHDLDG